MKYAIILPDGAADQPLPQLNNRTPLDSADIPNMDWIALHGRLGRSVTVPAGYTPATDVATLSLFGYDPATSYSGRAPIEAAAKGLTAKPDEIIFRCNFVTVKNGLLVDFTAHHVAQAEATRLIADLNTLFKDERCVFHTGVSYRNLMIAGDCGDLELITAPPHDIPNQPVSEHLPRGGGVERFLDIMRRAAEMLTDHEINRVRRARGIPLISDIWLWGQGRPVALPPFSQRFGVSGAVITGVDIIRGLAVSMGMRLIEVPGATGYIDTNYAGKGQAAVAALARARLSGRACRSRRRSRAPGRCEGKVRALERIDELVVGPVLEALRKHDEWKILVAPDHPTPVTTMAHDGTPPPFCYAGNNIDAVERLAFNEANAVAGGFMIEPGHKIMRTFFDA